MHPLIVNEIIRHKHAAAIAAGEASRTAASVHTESAARRRIVRLADATILRAWPRRRPLRHESAGAGAVAAAPGSGGGSS